MRCIHLNLITRRLRKKIAASYKYTFESNWEYSIAYTIDSNYFHVERTCDIPGYSQEAPYEDAVVTFNDAWDDETKEMISQFVFDEFNIPTSFDIKLTPEKVIATFTTNQELSDEQVDALKNYLSGQYSDGVGEGLEQHECYTTNEDVLGEGYNDRVADYMSFEEYVSDVLGEELPEDPDDDRYAELEDQYYEAEVEDVEINNVYYINMWPDNFSISLV